MIRQKNRPEDSDYAQSTAGPLQLFEPGKEKPPKVIKSRRGKKANRRASLSVRWDGLLQ